MNSKTSRPAITGGMNPLEVYCPNCLSGERSPCTTVRGASRRPHVARVRLSAAPGVCGECGAKYGHPCYKTSGGVRMYPHETRGLQARGMKGG